MKFLMVMVLVVSMMFSNPTQASDINKDDVWTAQELIISTIVFFAMVCVLRVALEYPCLGGPREYNPNDARTQNKKDDD